MPFPFGDELSYCYFEIMQIKKKKLLQYYIIMYISKVKISHEKYSVYSYVFEYHQCLNIFLKERIKKSIFRENIPLR